MENTPQGNTPAATPGEGAAAGAAAAAVPGQGAATNNVPTGDGPAPYTPPAQTGGQGYSGGGSPSSGNAISRFFEGISIGDVIITSLTICSFFFIIKYNRDALARLRDDKATLQAQLDEVTLNVKELAGESYQSTQTAIM